MNEANAQFSCASAAALIQARLESVRESISREICAVPTPIPGCDVNFNRLLEDRSEVVDALQRLNRLCRADAPTDTLLEFALSCKWLDAQTRAALAAAGVDDPLQPG